MAAAAIADDRDELLTVIVHGSLGVSLKHAGTGLKLRLPRDALVRDLKRRVWERCEIPLLQQLLTRGPERKLLDDEALEPLIPPLPPPVPQEQKPRRRPPTPPPLREMPITLELTRQPWVLEASESMPRLARANDVQAMALALRAPGCPNHEDPEDGRLPLHLAAAAGHLAVVTLLCDPFYLTDLNKALPGSGETPLHLAAAAGHVAVLATLLDTKCPHPHWVAADPMRVTTDGQTALHYAARAGKSDAVREICSKALSRAGRFVDVVMQGGLSALHVAVESRHQRVVEVLCEEAQCDRDLETEDRRTPLHFAAFSGQLPLAQLLCRSGAAWDEFLGKPSDGPAGSRLHGGAELDVAMLGGATPLHMACMMGHLGVARLLYDLGADKEARTQTGASPLHLACSSGHADIVKLWCESGVNKEVEMHGRVAPIHIVASMGNVEMMRVLVDAAAFKDQKRGDGATPLYIAVDCGHHAVVKYLCEVMAMPNKPADGGWTPCHAAALRGDLEALRLLTAHPELEINKTTTDGWSAIFVAAKMGHAEVIRHLVEKGCDAELPARDGRRAVHIAAQEWQVAAIQALSEVGADLNAQQLGGWTPLHIATHSGKIDIVRTLCTLGADRELTTKDDWTAQFIAENGGHSDVAKMLSQWGGM